MKLPKDDFYTFCMRLDMDAVCNELELWDE